MATPETQTSYSLQTRILDQWGVSTKGTALVTNGISSIPSELGVKLHDVGFIREGRDGAYLRQLTWRLAHKFQVEQWEAFASLTKARDEIINELLPVTVEWIERRVYGRRHTYDLLRIDFYRVERDPN
jgi:hypothetical protein